MSQCKRTLTCGTFHVAHLQFSEPLCGQTLAQSKNPQYMNVRQTATVLFMHYLRSDPAKLYSHPRLSTFPTTMPVKSLKFPLFLALSHCLDTMFCKVSASLVDQR